MSEYEVDDRKKQMIAFLWDKRKPWMENKESNIKRRDELTGSFERVCSGLILCSGCGLLHTDLWAGIVYNCWAIITKSIIFTRTQFWRDTTNLCGTELRLCSWLYYTIDSIGLFASFIDFKMLPRIMNEWQTVALQKHCLRNDLS